MMEKTGRNVRVLCLSFWAPPLVRPRAIAAGKVVPELIRQGAELVIVRYENSEPWEIGAPLYSVPEFEGGGVLQKFSLGRALLERRYYEKVFSVIAGIADRHKPDLVFSFSNPQQSNIVGAMLKKRLGIPFVSHFSDPFADNPYKTFSFLGGRKVRDQERFIIRGSDRVVFTNKAAMDLVMRKYPALWRAKARVIPHCFDPNEYPQESERKLDTDQFVFRHVGAFYKKRNPECFFEVLSLLLGEKPGLREHIRLELVGAVNSYTDYSQERLDMAVARYGLGDIVSILPAISYKESLAAMESADCLIAIDADVPESPFLPSKVVDYAGSGKPIVGITPSGSPTAEFLDGAGYRSFPYRALESLAEYLENIMDGTLQTAPNGDYLMRFDVKNVVAQLLKEFIEVLDSKHPRL